MFAFMKIPWKKNFQKPEVVAHANNPNSWEAEMGLLWIWSQPELQGKYQAILGYSVIPWLKTQNNNINKLLDVNTKNAVTSLSKHFLFALWTLWIFNLTLWLAAKSLEPSWWLTNNQCALRLVNFTPDSSLSEL